MTKYLISFPGEAVVMPEEDFEAVVEPRMPSSTRPKRWACTSSAAGSMRA